MKNILCLKKGMRLNMKSNKGITMIALIMTVIVLSILAGVTLKTGSDVLESSKLESIETNMLLIKTKGKEYVENANFKLGTNLPENASNIASKKLTAAKGELVGTEVSDMSEYSSNISVNISTDNNNFIYYYALSTENLSDMGINNVNSDSSNGWFIIKYDIKNAGVDVYTTNGYTKDGTTYYALSEIE